MTIDARYGSALPDIELAGDGLLLRAFAPDDATLIAEASNDPVIPTITTVPRTFSPTLGNVFIERQVQRRLSGEGWSLAIVQRESHRPVGQIGLWLANLKDGRAEISYWISPSSRGQATAGRALKILRDWAFEQLDIARLSLFIETSNIASIKTAEYAGFRQEAVLADWQRIGDAPNDMAVFVRLRRDRSEPSDGADDER